MMHTYTLIHIHSTGHTLRYFKSNRDDLDGLSYGREDFGIFMEEVNDGDLSPKDIEESHPQWGFVAKVIAAFDIDFEPFKNEDILIDLVPDEIELSFNEIGDLV